MGRSVASTGQPGGKDAGAEVTGPVQLLVVGFEGNHFTGEILPEIRRLQDEDIIRLIDLLFVQKDEEGDVRAVELSGLGDDDRERFGAVAGALVGFSAASREGVDEGWMTSAVAMQEGVFDARDIWAVADAIPKETSAAIAVLEHRWAIPLRDAVTRAGGAALADEWVHPLDLVAAGVRTSTEAHP